MRSACNDAYAILFSDFLYKTYVEAIQTSNNNIYYYKEVNTSTVAEI